MGVAPPLVSKLTDYSKSQNMNTALKGKSAEMLAAYKLLKSGYEVFIPLSENSKIDLIFEDNGSLKRAQVKKLTRTKNRNEYRFSVRKVHVNTKEIKLSWYTKDDVDCFIVADTENDKISIVPIEFIMGYKANISFNVIDKEFGFF